MSAPVLDPTLVMRPRNGLACLDLSLHWYVKVAARRLLRLQLAIGALMTAVFVVCEQFYELEGVIYPLLLAGWLTQGWYAPAVGQLLFDGHPAKTALPTAKQLLVWTLQELVLLVAFGLGNLFLIFGVPLMALSHLRAPVFFLERPKFSDFFKRWSTLASKQGGLMLTTWFWGTAFRFWFVAVLAVLATNAGHAFGVRGWFIDDHAVMKTAALFGAIGLWLTAPWWACLQLVTYVHARIAVDCWDLQVGALQSAAQVPVPEGTP